MQSYEQIRWFHSIELGDGAVTKGHKSAEALEAEFNALQLNADNLRGRRVLDIGCNDGYFALRCAHMGANVTAIDGVQTDGMKYIRRHVLPRLRFYCIDLLSPSFLELGRYDVILFLGVLYHTVYPFEQLQRLAAASNQGATVLIETAFYNLLGFEQEATIFYDFGLKLSKDHSSPIFPSTCWMLEMLRRVGFVDIATLSRYGERQGRITLRATYAGLENNSPFLYGAGQA